MHRRNFLLMSAAVTLALPHAAFAVTGDAEYSPELLKSELAAGKTVFIDFNATWCPTCKAQGRIIEGLKAENPAYGANIAFLNADWDTWGESQIVTDMNIPRRSTLVVLRGDKELGRIVAGTAKADIKALMDVALQAATA
jgi:thioredoxin 1